MRTLDDIVPPSRRQTPPPPQPPPSSPAPARRRFPFGLFFVILLIVAGSAGALYFFGGAEVRVTPRTLEATAQGSYTANTSGELTFTIISAERVASKTVASTGTRAVSSNASGKIAITNTSKTAVRLRATTRFESPNGLIFRIRDAVTVPAAKGTTPGTLSATVYADQTGSRYNIGPSSFTLPGFKGSPEFTEITAKSGVAMTGGASGNEPIIATDVESATRAALQTELKPALETDLLSKVPEGYILINGASALTYESLPSTPSQEAGQFELKEQGTIRAVVFPEAALAKAIASAVLANVYHGETLSFKNKDALTLSSANLPSASDPSFSFSLSGTTSFIYGIDANRIRSAVAGKTREEAGTALGSYPETAKVVIILRPFWRNSFPEDPASIRVVTENPV